MHRKEKITMSQRKKEKKLETSDYISENIIYMRINCVTVKNRFRFCEARVLEEFIF